MTKHILILGGGTGGTLAANRLRKALDTSDVAITVVDTDDRHVYQPGLLFVPFGLTEPGDIVRPRGAQLHRGIDYRQSGVERVDLAGAPALADALSHFDGGRLVVNVVDLPIKCPVAPLEFCFLADWYFHERGIRDRVQLTYVTPLDGAFTKPTASATLSGMLEERGIELVTEFNTGEVDGAGGRLVSFDGREVPFELAVIVPVHSGAAFVGNSPGLGDELDFVTTDEHTLQSKARPNVFAIGDAANLPISKAGSVTHFEGEVLVENIRRFLHDE